MTEWRKATFCTNGECVEVALCDDGMVHIRNSTDQAGAVVMANRAHFAELVERVKAGEFDTFAPDPD